MKFTTIITIHVNMSELKAMALFFNKAEKRFQEVFGTRWLSFEGVVGALLQNFDILVGCFLKKVSISHLVADVVGIVCGVSSVSEGGDVSAYVHAVFQL